MKHRLLVTPLLLMSMAVPVLAHEDTEVRAEGGVKAGLKASFEAKKLELNDLRTEAKGRMEEGRMNIAVRRTDMLRAVYNTALARLENIATRIESRIQKLKAEGKTTSDAEVHVAAARTDIADAKIHASAFAALNLDEGNVATSTFATARTEAQAVKAEFVSARENLKKSLEEIKSLEVRGEARASVESE